MNDFTERIELRLVLVIVNFGSGSKALKICKKCGSRGGTVLLGRGTVKNKLLELFELTDIRKEIVLTACRRETSDIILEELNKALHLDKPNHGIAFSLDISGVYGSKVELKREETARQRIGGKSMYTQIMVIVDKGKAEKVMDAANAAGGRGGTIINARGSGIHETSMLFAMEIEPEKEIVLILVKNDIVDSIINAVSQKMQISEPGNGIIFTMPVDKTCGMAE